MPTTLVLKFYGKKKTSYFNIMFIFLLANVYSIVNLLISVLSNQNFFTHHKRKNNLLL